jgi:hypothetical protein
MREVFENPCLGAENAQWVVLHRRDMIPLLDAVVDTQARGLCKEVRRHRQVLLEHARAVKEYAARRQERL